VFPLLRPFAIGLCILMFPTVVLGTLNAVMTPIVQGVATMLEGEKLDMQQYREQKDKLEYEAMKRNPETAYLVSNEEFDKQLEELGWSPGDLVTMTGMYVERGMKTKTAARTSFYRHSGSVVMLIEKSYSGFTGVTSSEDEPSIATSEYSFFASTLSVGRTATPPRVRNSPPTFFAFAPSETM